MAGYRSGLSDAQHRAIRQHIALLPLYGWSVFIWTTFVQQLPFEQFRGTWRVLRDFAHFYVLGLLARVHDASALYDQGSQRALVRSLNLPDYVDAQFVPSYGPQVAILFRPFASLPYRSSLLLYLSIITILYLVTVLVVSRSAPRLKDLKWPLAVAVVSAPAFHALLMYAQNTWLALGCFVVAYLCLERGRQFSAGLAIGALFYKPQLGVAAAVLIIAAGQWRVAVGAATSIAAQLGVAAVYWGAAVLDAYARALLRIPESLTEIEPGKQHLHSWRAFFQLAGLDGLSLTLATIGAAVITAAAAVAVWRSKSDLRVRFVALLAATALISPHMYVYDLVILTPAWIWLADISVEHWRKKGRAWSIPFLLGLLIYASPLFEAIAQPLHLQPSVIVLMLSLMWALFAIRTPPMSLGTPDFV